LAFECVNTIAAIHDKLPLSFEETWGDFEDELPSHDFINTT
jgi:hypothetical protein